MQARKKKESNSQEDEILDPSRSTSIIPYSFPPEMLGLVFQCACHCSTKHSTEISISHVCRLWRAVALSERELWATFFSRGTSRSEVERFAEYLKRSGDRLLCLEFKSRPTELPIVLPKLLKMAVEHSARWREFAVMLDDNTRMIAPRIYESLAGLHTPRLQRLKLRVPQGLSFGQGLSFLQNSGFHSSDTITFSKQGTHSPNLSILSTDLLSLLVCFPRSLKLVTVQLHASEGWDSAFDRAVLLELMKLPTLENLSIDQGVGFCNIPLGTLPPTIAPNLKNLRCNDTMVQMHLFEQVRAPQLELLILQGATFVSPGWKFPSENFDPGDNAGPTLYPSLRTVAFIDCHIVSFPTFQKVAYATKNATQVYATNRTSRCKSSIIYCMAKNPASMLWPELQALHCTTSLSRKSETEDYSDYLNIVKLRGERLGRHCKLVLPKIEAEFWRSQNPQTWSNLEAEHLYEELQVKADKSPIHGLDIIPWPPRDSDFCDVSELSPFELKFLSYNVA